MDKKFSARNFGFGLYDELNDANMNVDVNSFFQDGNEFLTVGGMVSKATHTACYETQT